MPARATSTAPMSPPLVPSLGNDLHFVLCDFGKNGNGSAPAATLAGHGFRALIIGNPAGLLHSANRRSKAREKVIPGADARVGHSGRCVGRYPKPAFEEPASTRVACWNAFLGLNWLTALII
jgi:hypothetical protein